MKATFLLLVLGIVTASIASHLFNPAHSARLEMLERHHAQLVSTIGRIQAENERLASELMALESGAEGWREVARREFGMIEPGEVVYRFPPELERSHGSSGAGQHVPSP